MRRNVTNEDHEALSFAKPICMAFMPHLTSWYRENYNENIEHTVLTPQETIDRMNIGLAEGAAPSVLTGAFTNNVYLLETTTIFSLVPPKKGKSGSFSGKIRIEVANIPGVDPRRQVWASLKVADGEENVLDLQRAGERGHILEFAASYEVDDPGKKVQVQLKTREYNYWFRNQLSAEMVVLTKGLSVVFSAQRDVYPDAGVFGVNVGEYEPLLGARTASISRSDLILLPGDGYAIAWNPPL